MSFRNDAELRSIHRLLCSGLIDEADYRAALGGGRADLSTVLRYIGHPVETRPPLTPYFDAVFYRRRNPELPATADPLLHFLGRGLTAWRDPHPLIDLLFMAGQDSALFSPHPTDAALAAALAADRVAPSPYFDLAEYGARPGALRHFLLHGISKALPPNRWLDPAWYAREYADVPPEPYPALRHFVAEGDAAGRAASAVFDGALYRRRYPDVADTGLPPLWHFLVHGRREGRRAGGVGLRVPAPTATPSEIEPGTPIPIDPAACRRDYEAFQLQLETARQARRRSARREKPPWRVSEDAETDAARVALPVHTTPRLTILIAAHDQARHTVTCLLTLAERPPACPFEVILADDGSTEPAYARLAEIPGLTVLRGGRNAGFLAVCNAAWPRCRGVFVLLLNNDAQPLPGAIDRLVAALDADASIAAAGGRLLFPDGALQEAGCFLRPNGESGLVGLHDAPDDPGYGYDRDVAYCSAACLLLRRAAVGPTLFDPAYAPAYCEDADLCLRLREDGHRVRYVAGAVTVHALGASAAAPEPARRRGVAVNQARLQARWGERLAADDRVRPIAFYLPQFHPIPENDLWWGAGFTEWTNVARARPSYRGHYQPHLPADLGFYDLRLPEVMRRQAALARRYGIEGFCVHHYDFGERRLLEAPMRALLADPSIPFRHCLCWANENFARNWDGGTKDVLIAQHYDEATLARVTQDVVRHALDPRSIRVDGKPLFLVYRPLSLPNPRAFAGRVRAALAGAGFPGAYLAYVDAMETVDCPPAPAEIGFDAAVAFPPHGGAVPAEDAVEPAKPGWTGARYDYRATALEFQVRPGVPWPRHPGVFPSWDNTPRQPLHATSFDGASPETFRAAVEAAIEWSRGRFLGEQRLLFINAWNEWAEGAHLEPDAGYGHRWLEALRDALAAKSWA